MSTRPLHSPNDGSAQPLNATVSVRGPVPKDARPALCPVAAERNQTMPQATGRASHPDWLASLKRGDMVRVRNGEETWPPAMVTNDSPCYVFVGKLKFHRRHGWQVARQSSCVYRMKLRLVRDEDDVK